SRVALLVAMRHLALARQELPRVLALARRFDIAYVTGVLSELAACEERPRAAARLVGHAQHAFAVRSMTPDADDTRRMREAEAFARSRLDEKTFVALFEEGGQLDDVAAERLALSTSDDASVTSAVSGAAG